MFPSILIVDDELSILKSLKGILSDEGFEVITAANGYEALKIIDGESPDLVLLDIWMPGIDGMETLKEIKKDNPFIQVIMITGHGTIETAVRATKLGAFDFIEKPLSIDRVIVAINNALNFRRLEEENRYLRKKTIEKHSLTGNSPQITEIKKQIAISAPTDTWIFLTGENGTGKELVARTIHQLSPRADQPLIDVNCAAIPDELIESELLGHEKGAFTEILTKKRGKLELADKGTLYLDEIGDMSVKTQATVLRVLQEKQFQRVGGSRTISVDVRVIAATHKNLEEEIAKGNFRKDLYYLLNAIPLAVPSLRDRSEDIPLLVESFLEECAVKNRKDKKGISREVIDLLCSYSWPGNVSELKNLVERLAIMVEKDIIDVSDMPAPYCPEAVECVPSAQEQLFSIKHVKEAVNAFEKEFIQRRLAEENNNITQTAEAIGVKRSYLYRKLKTF
ncbi:MAG: sigma-54-dependent Fis family transcriptional regulator [Deltaproteobacteria bacterium]|nr:sigma-54-dependent Fis family transcriptional regulator [Deltaproteobacteria bacterium]